MERRSRKFAIKSEEEFGRVYLEVDEAINRFLLAGAERKIDRNTVVQLRREGEPFLSYAHSMLIRGGTAKDPRRGIYAQVEMGIVTDDNYWISEFDRVFGNLGNSGRLRYLESDEYGFKFSGNMEDFEPREGAYDPDEPHEHIVIYLN